MIGSRNTLQNPLLYSNFVKQYKKQGVEIDPQLIDRHLEPSEAKRDLETKHGITLNHGYNPRKEYRSYLNDSGIRHPKLQRYLIRQSEHGKKPPRQQDIDQISYIMSARPASSWKRDIARKAKPAKSAAAWAKNPSRYDIKGVDSKGSIFNTEWF